MIPASRKAMVADVTSSWDDIRSWYNLHPLALSRTEKEQWMPRIRLPEANEPSIQGLPIYDACNTSCNDKTFEVLGTSIGPITGGTVVQNPVTVVPLDFAESAVVHITTHAALYIPPTKPYQRFQLLHAIS